MEKPENISWIPQQELEDPFKKYLNSAEDYLAFLCGPPRSHLFFPVTVVYALIFAVGVIGNLLVCLVILRHQTMKTPTNYYLFSLAISDLLVLLLGMPLEVYEMWRNYPFLFGSVGCYFKTALFETVCFASILSVTTVSVERYVAILHPFRAKLESTRRRALRILSIVWGFSVLFSLPNTSIHGIKFHYFPNGSLVPGSATCAVIKPMWIYNFIIQVTSFLFYILPMTVISVLYYLMGLRVSIPPGWFRAASLLFPLTPSSERNKNQRNSELEGSIEKNRVSSEGKEKLNNLSQGRHIVTTTINHFL